MKNLLFLLAIPLLLTACQSEGNKPVATTTTQQTTQPTDDELAMSIFQLPDTFRTQDDKAVTLADFKGKPTVISMIFTHCAFVCPRLTADMKGIATQMGPQANDVNFILVSFDTQRDLPARLKEYADSHELGPNFTLLHGSESAVRSLGVLLETSFEQDENGDFAHSNIVTVLDPYGIIRFRKEGLGQDHSQTIAEVKKYL